VSELWSGGGIFGASAPVWQVDEHDDLIEPPKRPGDRVVILLSSGAEIAGQLTFVEDAQGGPGGWVELDGKTDVAIEHIVAVYRLDADEEFDQRFVKRRPKK
jgi:hypothetical protein